MSDPGNDQDYQAFMAWQREQQKARQPEGPVEFYVHLADGRVLTLDEETSQASHQDGVQVVARYQVGA